jgi:integrase
MGAIQQRGPTRWTARWLDDRGKERAKSFRKKSDAQRFLVDIEADLQRGSYIDPNNKTTFGEYAEIWRLAQPHRETTSRSAQKVLARALPTLGERRIGSIRPSEIQAWVTGLVKRDGLAISTAATTLQTVKAIFHSAVRDRLIVTSPCEGVTLPQAIAKRVTPLSPETVRALVAAMDARFKALIVVGAGTGLRPGELFGLQLGDVDLLRRTLTVSRQLQEVPGGVVVVPPKTISSARTIPVSAVVLEALAEQVRLYPPGPEGWLFTAVQGGRIRRTNFMRTYWSPAARAAGIPSGTALHALRHYYASVLIAGGLSVKVVSARLGHTNANLTLNTYTHLWPEDEDRTRVVVEAALREAVTDARRTEDPIKVMEPPESGSSIASGGCWVRTNVG